jgi:hypothetical protein
VRQTKGSEGRAFRIGDSYFYAGPDDPIGPLPVLAVTRHGQKMKRVGYFKNSASAEAFIAALTLGIDEAQTPRIVTADTSGTAPDGTQEGATE